MAWASKHIEDLKQGQTVQFRPTGFSMTGKIENKQLCTVVPVKDLDTVGKGDVVLCKVGSAEYLHLVKAVRGKAGAKEFLIGNNRGGTNGWTRNIYGKCIRVEQ